MRPALQRRRESGQEEDGTLHTVVERYDGVQDADEDEDEDA